MQVRLADFVKEYNGRKVLRWECFPNSANDEFWNKVLSTDILEMDLDGLSILAHDGLIWLGNICLRRASEKKYTYISIPDDDAQIGYIKYVGFDRLQYPLSFGFTNEYLLNREDKYKSHDISPDSPRRIQLVTSTNWTHVVSASIRYMREFIIKRLGVQPLGQEAFEGVDPFTDTLQELIHNITLHGGIREGQGMGLISFTPPPPGFPVLRFCCNDLGDGFLSTMVNRRKEICRNDKEAITKALLHRFFHKESGIMGLYPTLAYIRARRGSIGIRSGSVLARLDLSRNDSIKAFDANFSNPTDEWLYSLLYFQESASSLGTHIYVDLRLDI